MDRALPGLLLFCAVAGAQGPGAVFDLDATFAAAKPPPTESRWTLVPWRHSLTEALAEAQRAHQPVYLFVNDGDVESGRC